MVNIIFGSSGSLGSSIMEVLSKKYKNRKFLLSSRNKPTNSKKNWVKFNLNGNFKKFKYKNINCCIFLASPKYIKKNMSLNIFNKEFLWIKKMIRDLKIEKLIYISSPTVYIKNHYVGANKIKIENFLLKNKKKFKTLQIWRPYNLVNTKQRLYSDHFHCLLYKIMFLKKKNKYEFFGNKLDARGYSEISKFSEILLKNAFTKKSFIKDFGNKNKVSVNEIIKLYNKYYFLKFKKVFVASFKSKKRNINVIKKNSRKAIYSNQNSLYVLKKYLLNNLYG